MTDGDKIRVLEARVRSLEGTLDSLIRTLGLLIDALGRQTPGYIVGCTGSFTLDDGNVMVSRSEDGKTFHPVHNATETD